VSDFFLTQKGSAKPGELQTRSVLAAHHLNPSRNHGVRVASPPKCGGSMPRRARWRYKYLESLSNFSQESPLQHPHRFTTFTRITVAASLACAVFSANAAVQSFQAASNAGTVVNFSYDDTAAGGLPDAFGISGGNWYSLLSFSINGAAPVAGGLIGLYNNFANGRDYMYLLFGPDSSSASVQLEDDDASVFTSNDLAQVNGLTLANFSGNSYWYDPNSVSSVPESLTSFGALAPVPETSAWAMGLLGLGALGVLARRRSR
jgi:MYXO-CTERM domain-containing protein